MIEVRHTGAHDEAYRNTHRIIPSQRRFHLKCVGRSNCYPGSLRRLLRTEPHDALRGTNGLTHSMDLRVRPVKY
jgi:hypothetical protein